MQEFYNHKKIDPQINLLWERGNYFIPKIDRTKKPFSIFLVPPNASGEMHIGNALMIAIQDILTRYHRAKGEPTLWIPSTDHGGYETQVNFERGLEKVGKDRYSYTSQELFEAIKYFVEGNNNIIKNQIKALGASVDWSRFRYTMDDESIKATNETFKKMVADGLIYRRPYMASYCPECATILADLELKEKKEKTPLYFIKFKFQNSDEYLPLATTRPEFLFTVTHVLIHPTNKQYANNIGKTLLNPITGNPVEIIASKRKFDPQNPEPFLTPFFPSYKKYDYEYTLRNSIPARNLLDWQGNMLERYPGLKPVEARAKEILFLKEHGFIEKTDDAYLESTFLCKRGHAVENVIMQTWFLKLDDKKIPLRKNALEAIKKENLVIFPKWREKGLMAWLEKMTDWPIARQNVWGIKIPIWYDISDPSKFIVWFVNEKREKKCGNLQSFLDQGVPLKEVSQGLERIYTSEDAAWTLDKEAGKNYLPETDTFDTWFSSGQWGTIVFNHINSDDFSYFYPSNSIVIGHDLLRLSISRKILLSQYLNDRLPFKTVYLHSLIKGQDGQKMSKSIGNAVSLEYYLEKFGADATRMALISHTTQKEDFLLLEDQFIVYQNFAARLWKIGQMVEVGNQLLTGSFKLKDLSQEDKNLLLIIDNLPIQLGLYIEKFLFARAQTKLCDFLSNLEGYAKIKQPKENTIISLSILKYVFKKYLLILHPFMPFTTEQLYGDLYGPTQPLAASPWPNKMNYFDE
ncbi:MAG: class I tRNA ligase family protein [Candidatus Buchananbacteria bacterium]